MLLTLNKCEVLCSFLLATRYAHLSKLAWRDEGEEGGGEEGEEEEEEVDGWGRGEGKRRRGKEGLTVISNMDIGFLMHYSLGSSVQLVMHPFDVANQKILNILSHILWSKLNKQMTYMSWLVQGFCSRLGELSRTKLVV